MLIYIVFIDPVVHDPHKPMAAVPRKPKKFLEALKSRELCFLALPAWGDGKMVEEKLQSQQLADVEATLEALKTKKLQFRAVCELTASK